MDGPVEIYGKRRKWFAAAALFGFFAVAAVIRGVETDNTSGIIISLAICGGVCAACLRLATRRGPRLVVDADALTDGVSGRVVPWDDVRVVVAETHQGAFGLDHSMSLFLNEGPEPRPMPFIATNKNNPEEVGFSIDSLSLPWDEIVALVEHASGRRVVRQQTAGLSSAKAPSASGPPDER